MWFDLLLDFGDNFPQGPPQGFENFQYKNIGNHKGFHARIRKSTWKNSCGLIGFKYSATIFHKDHLNIKNIENHNESRQNSRIRQSTWKIAYEF